jgi:hypothetical protein
MIPHLVSQRTMIFTSAKSRPLYQVTLAELMNHPSASEQESNAFEAEVRDGWRSLQWDVIKYRLMARAQPGPVPGYLIGHSGNSQGFGAIAIFDKASSQLVGGLSAGTVWVHKDHRGKGIGPEVIILAFELGIIHPDNRRILSDLGRNNRRKAHKLAIQRALDSRIEVDPEVLADYPELARGSAPPS